MLPFIDFKKLLLEKNVKDFCKLKFVSLDGEKFIKEVDFAMS